MTKLTDSNRTWTSERAHARRMRRWSARAAEPAPPPRSEREHDPRLLWAALAFNALAWVLILHAGSRLMAYLGR